MTGTYEEHTGPARAALSTLQRAIKMKGTTMTATKLPSPKFVRDGERYIVMCGDDRAGFVRKWHSMLAEGRSVRVSWNAVDTFMVKSRWFPTREKAGAWLAKELAAAIERGDRMR
jgi:hypothetical protein